ncbi:MAG: FtsX-like permease family protein [Burkholderiaceae bacterium]|nr:FtsX-like permease family protein [Burkholderiaceae bacterium]
MRSMLFKGWKAFCRDIRLTEVRLLMAALALGVAAVSSVGFLVDRFDAALQRDAAQLLGGDIVLSSDHAIAPDIAPKAVANGLRTAESVSFPSMVTVKDNSVLASAKAVSRDYPLRGKLTLADASGVQTQSENGPPRGQLWVDESLLSVLNIKIGDSLKLGAIQYPITRIIVLEPDRGAQFANFSPRVMLHLEDLPATELVQPGSRLRWRMAFAGEPAKVKSWQLQLEKSLTRGQRLESLESGRPEMQQTLDRAQRFLSLVSLIAALIASVAVLLAAREYVNRQQNGIAIARTFGLQSTEIMATLAVEFFLIAVLACLTGATLGWGLHWVLAFLLQDLVGIALPAPTAIPVLTGMAIGALLTAGVVMPRVLQLAKVPTLAVIRKDAIGLARASLLAYLLAAAGVFGLLVLSVRDTQLALGVAAGFAIGTLVFAVLVRGITAGLAKLAARGWKFALRTALAACARRPQGVVVQTLALSVGLMAIALLVLIRGDLISAWQKSVPKDAPNRFVINIQPDQTLSFKQQVLDLGLASPELNPMIRARLIEKNGAPIGPENFTDERAKRLVDREFNASYASVLPQHNKIKEGSWFAADKAEISMETGIMETLGLKLGDMLTFDIGGQTTKVKITSTRQVAWDSMRVNFFAIGSPAAFSNQAQTFISALNVPDHKSKEFQALVKVFPNITIIDTRNVIAQVQNVLTQVIRAVEFLFLFALIAGVVVLFVASSATRDERRREAAVMRALGASSKQIRSSQAWEFAIIGGIAGLLAATGASLLAFLIGKYGFNFTYLPSLYVASTTVLAGVFVSLAGGWWAVRDAVNTAPIVTLREAL